MTTRYFVVEPDRVFIPPKGLLAAPGGKPARFAPGELVELPAVRVDRFVRGRKAAGDIREVTEAEAQAIKAQIAAAPAVPAAPPAPVTETPARASFLTDRDTGKPPIAPESFLPAGTDLASVAALAPTAPAPARPEE